MLKIHELIAKLKKATLVPWGGRGGTNSSFRKLINARKSRASLSFPIGTEPWWEASLHKSSSSEAQSGTVTAALLCKPLGASGGNLLGFYNDWVRVIPSPPIQKGNRISHAPPEAVQWEAPTPPMKGSCLKIAPCSHHASRSKHLTGGPGDREMFRQEVQGTERRSDDSTGAVSQLQTAGMRRADDSINSTTNGKKENCGETVVLAS